MMTLSLRYSAVAVALLLSSVTTCTMADIRLDEHIPEGWYSAYSKYPSYCSTPAAMMERKIPKLRDDSHIGETRLVHAATVIRHGARTPASPDYTCWKGYWENPATGVWNCSLTMEMAPPTPKHIKQEEGQDGTSYSNTVALFDKQYDALMDKENGLSNHFSGNCQMGQLLLQGYEQQVTNGQYLREAYCFDSNGYQHDQRMRLIDLNANNMQPWAKPQIYFRSDDDQRTLLSGQALLRSMLQPEIEKYSKKTGSAHPIIPVHLADRDRDVLGVNERICPRLTKMKDKVHQSSTFKAFNQSSSEAKTLRKFMSNDLQSPADLNIDCLMTTVCTDRPLPDEFDYEGDSDMFDRLTNFLYRRNNMLYMANGAGAFL